MQRKAAFGLVARLQKVLRAEDGDVARLKHQSLSSTGCILGDTLGYIIKSEPKKKCDISTRAYNGPVSFQAVNTVTFADPVAR